MLQQSASCYPIVLLLLSILQKRSFIGYVVTWVICCWVFTDVDGLESHLPLATSSWGLSPKFGSHWVTSWAALVLPSWAVGILGLSWPCSKWPKTCETRRGQFSLAASEWLPWPGCREAPGQEGAGTGMGGLSHAWAFAGSHLSPFGKEVGFEQMPL